MNIITFLDVLVIKKPGKKEDLLMAYLGLETYILSTFMLFFGGDNSRNNAKNEYWFDACIMQAFIKLVLIN